MIDYHGLYLLPSSLLTDHLSTYHISFRNCRKPGNQAWKDVTTSIEMLIPQTVSCKKMVLVVEKKKIRTWRNLPEANQSISYILNSVMGGFDTTCIHTHVSCFGWWWWFKILSGKMVIFEVIMDNEKTNFTNFENYRMGRLC